MIFVHLYNDHSGSPRVLASVIQAIGNPERDILLIARGDGVLQSTDIPKVYYRYRRFANRWLTLLSFVISQVDLFSSLCRQTRGRPKDEMLYINTAYPFAAGLFGWLFNRPVIYHLHEISITPAAIKSFLWWVVRFSASEVRFVSEHQKQATGLEHRNTKVIYNGLSKELTQVEPKLSRFPDEKTFNVLMLSTLREYKGIPEYFELARSLEHSPRFTFQLVTNDDPEAVARYLNSLTNLPANVAIIPRTSDLAPLYRQSNLVVNLSRPDEWVETFGLTLLEAMSFGVPVIAPPAGGPIELLGGDLKDYLISGDDKARLASSIEALGNDEVLYSRISTLCLNRASKFSWKIFSESLQSEAPVSF